MLVKKLEKNGTLIGKLVIFEIDWSYKMGDRRGRLGEVFVMESVNYRGSTRKLLVVKKGWTSRSLRRGIRVRKVKTIEAQLRNLLFLKTGRTKEVVVNGGSPSLNFLKVF